MELNLNCENEIFQSVLSNIKPKQTPNLNQNVWILVIALLGVGFAEYFRLKVLLILGIILSVIAYVSILYTTIAYSINYWNKKMKEKNI